MSVFNQEFIEIKLYQSKLIGLQLKKLKLTKFRNFNVSAFVNLNFCDILFLADIDKIAVKHPISSLAQLVY